MIQTFTADDVLRYLYDETTEEENLLIQDALLHDPEMLECYLEMLDVKLGLEQSYLEPSQKTIDNILAFACSAAHK
jgi:hypothetical protein